MQEAQRLTRAIKPVIKKAGELIDNSSIVIEGMENYKGVYQNTLFEKVKRKIKSPFQDKKEMTGMGGYTQGPYQLPAIDSGKYSEKELELLALFS